MANSVTKYLTNKILSENIPVIDTKLCINGKQKRLQCKSCVKICPKKVLVKPEKNVARWSDCIDCGLCSVVCPSKAIRPSVTSVTKLIEIRKQQGDCIIIGCEKVKQELSAKLSCLCALPWEALASFALERPVYIIDSACANCPDAANLKTLQETLNKLKVFLGTQIYAERVSFVDSKEEVGTVVDRKQALNQIFTRSKSVVGAVAPREADMTGMLYRYLLANVLKKVEQARGPEAEPLELAWSSPVFSKKCWGCDKCEKACPNNAIMVVQDDAGTRFMAHWGWKCTRCGICKTACVGGAITGYEYRVADAPMKPFVTAIDSRSCEECGAAIKPVGNVKLCQKCQTQKGMYSGYGNY